MQNCPPYPRVLEWSQGYFATFLLLSRVPAPAASLSPGGIHRRGRGRILAPHYYECMPKLRGFAAIAAVTAALALGGGAAGAVFTSDLEVPTIATQPAAALSFTIDDPQGILSSDDRQALVDNQQRLQLAAPVRSVYYLMLGKSRSNVNDSVEEFFRAHHPEAIKEDTWADGVLILGVATDQRKVFAFAGDDVASTVNLEDRLETIIDSMVPGMRDNNIPAALFNGTRTAADSATVQEVRQQAAADDRTGIIFTGAAVSGAVGFAASSIAIQRRRRRARAIATAREDYQLVTGTYADLAARLDSLDIRAHSLHSELADATLRRQWEDVRDRFLALHEVVNGAGGLGDIAIADPKQAYTHHTQLSEAATTVTQLGHAEDNINRIFNIENGDAASRRLALADIRNDLRKAEREISGQTLLAQVRALLAEVEALDANVTAPNFVDRFVRVLGDYRELLEAVKNTEFNDVKERHQLVTPTLYDPGYWYSNYITYSMLNSWHTSNVQAAEAATAQSSSGGINTSFSSGFSGAGGSGGY